MLNLETKHIHDQYQKRIEQINFAHWLDKTLILSTLTRNFKDLSFLDKIRVLFFGKTDLVFHKEQLKGFLNDYR